MTKGELKSIIKEAIMELVADGALSSKTFDATGPRIVRQEEKNAIVEQKKVKSMQMVQKHLTGPNDPFAALLADTAQNTILAEQEKDTYGTTIESRQKFDEMFPSDLREHFNSLFNKSIK